MTISNIQKRGAAGEDEGKRGVWYGEGGRWGGVGWGDGWMGGWARWARWARWGAPSGPKNCRVGANPAFFAPRGPGDGPLGALSRLVDCVEMPGRGRAGLGTAALHYGARCRRKRWLPGRGGGVLFRERLMVGKLMEAGPEGDGEGI